MTDPQPLAAPDPITTAPKPTLRRLFYGDDGLRAGWSFALFLILFIFLVRFGNYLVDHLHILPPHPPKGAPVTEHDMTPRSSAIGEALGLFALLLASLAMSLIERRPFARYGFTTRRMPTDFLVGLFWGAALLSALIGGLVLTHTLAFDGIALHGATALLYAGKWAFVFFLVGAFEEYLFRGYFQYTVARGVSGIVRTMTPDNRYSHLIGFWVTALIFSVGLFMAGHLGNSGESLPGIIAVGLAGAVFSFSLYRTGSLWWAIGFHTSWDWAQSYFYGTADSATHVQGHFLNSHPTGSALLSGGAVGPEGSLLVVPTLLLVAVVIHFTLPRRDYPLTPDQSAPPDTYVPLLPDQLL